MLSKGKNFEEMCVYNHGDTCLFRSTFSPYMQIRLHPADFAGDKSVAFDFSGACLLGQPVYNYFDYQYFLSFASDFHFNL